MHDDYYDYTPTVTLDKPLVLAGYLGEENRQLGYKLAALTGLPSIDLDRKIEHHSGRSIWELIWSEGETSYRELERRHLTQSLRERPCGVLTVGDGALIDPANRRRAEADAHLVVLDRDAPHCFWSLKRHPNAQRDFWHPLHAGPLENLGQVRPYFDRRRAGLSAAPHQIDLRGRRKSEVLNELIQLVEALG